MNQTSTKTVTNAKSSSFTVQDIALIALFAALMTICSWISIPTTVPFTLQTFAVFAAVATLGGKRGTISILVYLLLGSVGLPVFSGFKGGIGVLFGVTGGYLVGFLVLPLIVWAATHFFGSKTIVLAISMIIGLIVCYALGTAWFMVVYTQSTGAIGFTAILGMCVFPFVIPDLIKLAVALLISSRIKAYIK